MFKPYNAICKMKNINLNTWFTLFAFLFILTGVCSLLHNAYEQETLVFTPATTFLMKLHPILNLPTNGLGYNGFVNGLYGILGGLVINVLLYSFAIERFVYGFKSLCRKVIVF